MAQAELTWKGERLRQAREALELSRRELVLLLHADGLEMSEMTLENWENGKTAPGADDLAILARNLKKSISSFYLAAD